jgi:hypothetical protein
MACIPTNDARTKKPLLQKLLNQYTKTSFILWLAYKNLLLKIFVSSTRQVSSYKCSFIILDVLTSYDLQIQLHTRLLWTRFRFIKQVRCQIKKYNDKRLEKHHFLKNVKIENCITSSLIIFGPFLNKYYYRDQIIEYGISDARRTHGSDEKSAAFYEPPKIHDNAVFTTAGDTTLSLENCIQGMSYCICDIF